MKHPRVFLLMVIICLAFWCAVAWSCHGAPGGTPSPQAPAQGQTEIRDPRGPLSVDRFFQALCLNQDPPGAKLILQTSVFNALQPGIGKAHAISARGNCSPGIRSITETVRSCGDAKEYLVGVLPHTRAHNELLNTNWLVEIRIITQSTT